jgi:hypothetical protein
MNLSYNQLIGLLVKYTVEPTKSKNELGEQDSAGGTTTGGGGSGYPTVTKWLTGLKRGKANPLMSKDEKPWETGLTRGKANTLL